MKVVRKITYETSDTEDGEIRLVGQLAKSFKCGTYELATKITVEHVQGPKFETDGQANKAMPLSEQVTETPAEKA